MAGGRRTELSGGDVDRNMEVAVGASCWAGAVTDREEEPVTERGQGVIFLWAVVVRDEHVVGCGEKSKDPEGKQGLQVRNNDGAGS